MPLFASLTADLRADVKIPPGGSLQVPATADINVDWEEDEFIPRLTQLFDVPDAKIDDQTVLNSTCDIKMQKKWQKTANLFGQKSVH